MTVKICTIATIPDELSKAWMQHLRDFDAAHPGCHFEVMADAPKLTIMEISEALQVNPSLDFQAFFDRKPE